MPKQTKPSIVFAHGLWADGSCFSKLIPSLQADGHDVICSQHGLDSLKGDVDCVTRCFGRVTAPVVLVGLSYGGTLITHAGVDERVAALVYIAALAPDETETSQSQQQKFRVTDVFSHIEVADGRIWLKPSGIEHFAGDLPDTEQQVVWATQAAPVPDLFLQKVEGHQTPADVGDGVGPQHGSGPYECRTKRANESLNTRERGRRIKQHLDDLNSSLDQSRADRHCLVAGNPAQDGDEGNPLQTCPKRGHPRSFRAAFQLRTALASSPRQQR
jgi:pimeloyl-ACP methyl ester carboxylesterase